MIQDEVEAYLANRELAKRPPGAIQSKRQLLRAFLSAVPKKFAAEFYRGGRRIGEEAIPRERGR